MINYKIILLLSLAAYMPGGRTNSDEDPQVSESINNYNKEKENWPSIPDEVLEKYVILSMGLELRERVLKHYQIKMDGYQRLFSWEFLGFMNLGEKKAVVESLKKIQKGYKWAVLRFMNPTLLNNVLRQAMSDDKCTKKYLKHHEKKFKNAEEKLQEEHKTNNLISNIDENLFWCKDIVGSFIETCIDGHCTFNYDYLRLTHVTQDHVSPVPTKNIVLHLRREYGDKHFGACIEDYYGTHYEDTDEYMEEELSYEQPEEE